MQKYHQSFIDGSFVENRNNDNLDNINPALNKRNGSLWVAEEDTVDQAVDSAQKAFQQWSRTSPTERGRVLKRTADLLREHKKELVELEVTDTGKPITEARDVDVDSAADALEYFGGLAASLHGDHIDMGGSFAITRREPLGVCAGIGAWNYPLQIACWKAAPALACGNAMVYKPAELTPMSSARLAEIFIEAGLPEGVFNLVQGDARTGKALTTHEDIAKVSLTGEVGTGKKVMEAAAGTLKHVTLELGGKSPILVFEDADIDDAVSGAIMGNFYTQGEICSNGTRVYVHESIKDEFMQRLVERTQKMVVGDPMDPNTDVGALISHDHMEKVLNYIELGKDAGAKLLCGGERVQFENEELNEGFFVSPAVFDACTDDMEIVKEEIFGPVMSVLSFKDEYEVVDRANNTPYGLSAGVFTNNLKRAHRVTANLEAGTLWVNNYNVTPIEMPFGPYKQSGFGRENGRAAIDYYSQLKTIYFEMDKVDAPY